MFASDYALPQVLLAAAQKVRNGAIYPRWLESGERFWYERRATHGVEYRIIEASTGAVHSSFTRAEIAAALSQQLEADVDAESLILRGLRISDTFATFDAFGDSYSYDIATRRLSAIQKRSDPQWLVSPDGKRAAFVRDHNLWIIDLDTRTERSLTTDGTERYAYADSPLAMRIVRKQAIGQLVEARWSPDGRRILAAQVDDRHVPDLPYVEFAPEDGIRTRVVPNPTSLPGDAKPTEFRLFSVDVDTGGQVEARYPRLCAVRMNDTPFAANLAWWGDARTAYFVDVERGEKVAHVIAFDTDTGATREVFVEHSDTYVELSVNVYAPALIYPVPGTQELVWYSERSGHGHLYLYDLATGSLKHPITAGNWQIREILHVDFSSRRVFFLAAGISADEDPYVCKPCAVSLDGGPVRILSGSVGEHVVWRAGEFSLALLAMEGHDRFQIAGLSPHARYFVESVGTGVSLPSTYLRRIDGSLIAKIEQADGLPAEWRWPEVVCCKAADGATDVYGMLFKPPVIEPGETYPLIDDIYGGPQVNVVPKIAFGNSISDGMLTDAAHLAALGCFVLILDGRGTANRERAFRVASYGAVHTASNLEDHVSAIRQLAQHHPIDLERIGITGFSGGGYMAAMAMLRYGNFFKVAVAGGGNYDQAIFWHCWGERYHGPYSPEHYATQAARTYAASLKGKLLLVHGLLDSGCHPGALFQLVQALIDVNKDVDLVVLPRDRHTWSSYGMRRRLDYFMRYLMNAEPPAGAKLDMPLEAVLRRLKANAVKPAKRTAS